MNKWRVTALLALLTLLMPTVALAVDAPTSITIDNVDAYRNLAESGDVLIVFDLAFPYDSDNYPTTPASTSISLRLMDTDNVTVLQTTNPYVFPYFESNGYGENMGSFYFTASDNYTWGDLTRIDVILPPAFFSPGDIKSYSLTLSDYTDSTTQEANRTDLKSHILLKCDDLASNYQDTGIVMKSTSDVGIILSPYGDLYFRGVIPSLQTLCPDLFFIQSLIPETIDTQDYDMSLRDTYTDRLAADDLGEGFDRLGDLLGGIGGGFAAAALTFAGSIGICIFCIKKNWGVEIGLAASSIIAIMVSILVGDIVFTIMMIGALVAGMGIVWLLFLKRSS